MSTNLSPRVSSVLFISFCLLLLLLFFLHHFHYKAWFCCFRAITVPCYYLFTGFSVLPPTSPYFFLHAENWGSVNFFNRTFAEIVGNWFYCSLDEKCLSSKCNEFLVRISVPELNSVTINKRQCFGLKKSRLVCAHSPCWAPFVNLLLNCIFLCYKLHNVAKCYETATFLVVFTPLQH